MKISLKKVLNYLAIFIIFSGAWSYNIRVFAEFRGLYIIIVICLLFWLPFLKGAYFHKGFLFLFSVIVAVSFYNVITGNDTAPMLIKQIMGIFFNAFVFYLLVRINDYDLKGLFKIYLRVAFIVALIGIIQEVSYILKFKPGYDYRKILPVWDIALVENIGFLRVNSILPESTFFCTVLIPAFFVSLTSFLKNTFHFQKKWQSIIIIVSFLLSFSVVGYVGVLFAVILALINNMKFRYIALCAVIIWGLGYFSYNRVTVMKGKIKDVADVLAGKSNLERTNLSVYAFFSNALVAYNSFNDNPLFGHGLGSHQVSYEKYVFKQKIIPASIHSFALCRGDAGSLFLRLLSETGLFGVAMFFVFMAIYYIPKRNDSTGYLWIINNAVLSMFFIKMIRMGNYFVDGFFFFFWMYYFSKRYSKEQITENPQKTTVCRGINGGEVC